MPNTMHTPRHLPMCFSLTLTQCLKLLRHSPCVPNWVSGPNSKPLTRITCSVRLNVHGAQSVIALLRACTPCQCPRPCGHAQLVDEFAADYIFKAGGEVVELVEAFEQPTAGYRAGRGHRFRGVGRVREEDSVHPETGKLGGGRWSTGM
jgi:hypothetical protein